MATELQKWEPAYDRVVILSLLDYPPKEIAEIEGLKTEKVRRILKDPKAVAVIEEGRSAIKKHLLVSMADRMAGLAEMALRNLEVTMSVPLPLTHKMKRHQDKVSLDLLKLMVGREGAGQGGLAISPEGEERLMKALEKSNEVQEAEWEDVTDGSDAVEVAVEAGPGPSEGG